MRHTPSIPFSRILFFSLYITSRADVSHMGTVYGTHSPAGTAVQVGLRG
jgi:hypothetical protein